ncbi:hypothetical protein QNH10_15240 [Sporosarcina thermotolerans]|uniref:hypothetical protein n=1 Tax=Sporosarcina thermotolerans TaxID=633404 RepID=UPI0024BC5562|nr:hypothetical protein [Sporosarcina thermotolerans]WHT49950.1 hypothetical protein QNH10_15240 [Sporosarcina thermotolerans]
MRILNEIKTKSDQEAKMLADAYGINLSVNEIRALRPLLDEISFHWLFTGIPESFLDKVKNAVGDKKVRNCFVSI